MYFSDNPTDRYYEKMMVGIPNFRPRGEGVMVICEIEFTANDCDCMVCNHCQKKKEGTTDRNSYTTELAGYPSLTEALIETLSPIQHHAFKERLSQYLIESGFEPMIFKNDKHRIAFEKAINRMDKQNYALMAVVYLLTADYKLWKYTERYVKRNKVFFECIRLYNISDYGYTLYCAAKDLCLGTKNLTISDLADTELIAPKTFGIICNAMAIRRFGLGAFKYKERTDII